MDFGFFKAKISFELKKTTVGWFELSISSEIKQWQDYVKTELGIICSSDLNYDDYLIGPSDADVAVFQIHSDPEPIEAFLKKHGFLKNDNEVYSKKFTEKQFVNFLKDLGKLSLKMVVEKSRFKNILSFDRF